MSNQAGWGAPSGGTGTQQAPNIVQPDDVTEESLEQAAQEIFGDSQPLQDAAPSEQPSEVIQEDQQEAQQEAQFDPNERIEVAPGVFITRSEAAGYATFDQMVQQDPALAQLIINHINRQPSQQQISPPAAPPQHQQTYPGPVDGRFGGGSPTTYPQSTYPPQQYPQQYQQPQPQIPPEIDLSDPTTAYLWQNIQQQQQILQNQQAELRRQQSLVGSRVEADIRTAVNTATDNFRNQHSLDDQAISEVRNVAARLEVINTIMDRGIDPITGLPTSPDPVNAVSRALEIAANLVPQVREKIFANSQLQTQADTQRKRNLTAISGGSKTAPRATVLPNTKEGREAAMRAEVEAYMNGSTTESVN